MNEVPFFFKFNENENFSAPAFLTGFISVFETPDTQVSEESNGWGRILLPTIVRSLLCRE
jgi:hypothetical protein